MTDARILIADGTERRVASGPVCVYCNGRGLVERYRAHLRRRGLVNCRRCSGWGRTGTPVTLPDAGQEDDSLLREPT